MNVHLCIQAQFSQLGHIWTVILSEYSVSSLVGLMYVVIIYFTSIIIFRHSHFYTSLCQLHQTRKLEKKLNFIANFLLIMCMMTCVKKIFTTSHGSRLVGVIFLILLRWKQKTSQM